jgi:dihydroorotase
MVILAMLALAQYDLVLQGGRVIDPKNNIDRIADVAVRGGRIAAVGEGLSGTKNLDVKGLIVTPGLIDIHVHLFATTGIQGAWAGDNSVLPDGFSFRTGVTTMADAGSSGWRNFETFRHTVIDRAKTRVLAFINIAGLGMMTDIAEQGDFDPKEVARLAKKHPDVVVGVKSAHYQGPDWSSVDAALEAAREANIPIMVDFGYFRIERPFWKLVTERLRPGDIATHMFRGPVPYADESGKLPEYLQKARERGVKFDVGHGGGSFVFRNADAAVKAKFYPDSISTDLHTGSMNGSMMDMPTTMSKMLALGVPLVEVIRESTANPAMMIGEPELGHLTVGAPADIAVWQLIEGDFGFMDFAGGGVRSRQRLVCDLTIKDGKVEWNWNARGAKPWRDLPRNYGIRPGLDHIVLPK